MHKIIILLLVVAVGYFVQINRDSTNVAVSEISAPDSSIDRQFTTSDSAIANAYKTRKSNIQIGGSGRVIRVLADDNDGSRHQRFILQLSSNQTLLVAHNIDIAPRIAGLSAGDTVEFFGEYEWNDQGGVIHWTHHDPNASHTGGWLKHQGRSYQ